MEKENKNEEEKKEESEEFQVSIAAPMFFWMLLLVVAMVINVIVNAGYISNTQIQSIAKSIANFILFMPGSIILPTIVGAFIGAEIGKRSKSLYVAIKSSIINGIYAVIIYLIAIFIIYEVILYILPSINPGVNFLEMNWLAIPGAMVIALSIIFAALSHSRKVI